MQHDSHAPWLTSDILNILCGFFTTGVIFESLSHSTWFLRFYSRALCLEDAGQDRTAGQHFTRRLLPCASCWRLLRAAPRGAQHPGREAGAVAGARHLQTIAAPRRIRGETPARGGRSQAGFSLASLNTSRRGDAKQVIAWVQDTIPGSQLLLKPMSSWLHCSWHLINTISDMQSSL